ncbi:MAG: heparinase II/III family protein [Armatimonadota bacterium]
MFRFIFNILLILVFITSLSVSGTALAVFDDILNYPIVDTECPQDRNHIEGLSLAGRGIASYVTLSRNNPVGQTIKVHMSNAQMLWRICLGICYYPNCWTENEILTMTVWDSPIKNKKLYSRTLTFEDKWYKWDIPFDVKIPAKKGDSFYLELTTNGDDDNSIHIITVDGNDYKDGIAYLAGKPQEDLDLYFVTIVKPLGNKKANYEKFLSRINLDYPPLSAAKKAYEDGNLEDTCILILRHFENRTEPDSLIPEAKPLEHINFPNVDNIVDLGRYYKTGKLTDPFVRMDDQTTWRETWPDSPEYLRQNDIFRYLGEAYQTTGNEKYARKLNQLMYDYINDNASPFDGGMRGGRWVSLHQGWRLGDAWEGWGAACKSEGFTDDVKLGWIDYQARMAKYIELEPSGANQENSSADALLQFALRFPEFAESEKWQIQGYDRLMSNSLKLFRPDGGSEEPTMNYQGFALSFLLRGIETAKKHNLEIPDEIIPRLEKIYEFMAIMLMPDGQTASNGDTNFGEFRPNKMRHTGTRDGTIVEGAKKFNRDDLLYIGTAGKDGKKPDYTSIFMPYTKYAILRSDWNSEGFEQARYMLFRAGYPGGHGHYDYNSIVLYAYGRQLLIDPGRAHYGTPLQSDLEKAFSHNVLLVDGMQMNNVDPTLHYWQTLNGMDIIDNEYVNLYNGVNHRRAVIFVKPDYYLLFDNAVSQNPVKMGVNYMLTPPELEVDTDNFKVISSEPEGSNILVQCLGANQIAQRNATVRVYNKEVIDNMPVATFWNKESDKSSFVSLLYPAPTGVKPSADMTMLRNDDVKVSLVTHSKGKDIILYSKVENTNADFKSDKHSLNISARSAVIRMNNDNDIISISIVDGSKIEQNNIIIAEGNLKSLTINYEKEKAAIYSPDELANIKISAMGRTYAALNGKKVPIKNGYIEL